METSQIKGFELVCNTRYNNVYNELKDLFSDCISFRLSVAFINYSGLQLLIDSIKACEKKGVKGKVLCSDYLCFTDPNSLKKLCDFSNVETKMFIVDDQHVGFHTKGYIFEFEDCFKVLIGSSNVTQSALKSNIEWNLKVISKKDDDFILSVLDAFDELMDRSSNVDNAFVEKYEELFEKIKSAKSEGNQVFESKIEIQMNPFQKEALQNLKELRKKGSNKVLLVASTGVGKTYASAFDVKEFDPKRMLFIVHNENILNDAIKSFKRIMPDKTMGMLTGTKKDVSKDFIFSTIQTMHNHKTDFSPDCFDYIIFDEAHRTMGKTYLDVINYFNPKFMLGMTATPERTDGENIFKLFDYNIASNIRLRDALSANLLTPFHYFGVNDDTVDLSDIDLSDEKKISSLLSNNERVNTIVKWMEHYGNDGYKRKALAFCVDKKHCEYMANAFKERGYDAISLTGEDDPTTRDKYIQRLQSDSDSLEIICTVNIFNEGVDIPQVNLILMLRPTESSIIFTQQLGRGLRKVEQKEFLTVIDYISNHSRCYLIAVALSGKNGNDKVGTRSVITNGGNIDGGTVISIDPIAAKKILDQLDQTNFNNLINLRNLYNEFEAINGGEIPSLLDYTAYSSAPDVLRFIKYAGNYLSFINVIKRVKKYDISSEEKECLDYFSKMLPFKHIAEIICLKMLFENKCQVRFGDFSNELDKYIALSEDRKKYAFNYLSGSYFDSQEKKKYSEYIELHDDKLIIGKKLKEYIKKEYLYEHLKQIISYGLIIYKKEFGMIDYGRPFIKLYSNYNMKELGLLSEYTKCHSSIRGTGLWHDNNKNYYLFVDLHKDASIREAINYKDEFVSTEEFNWESPNQTTQNSSEGKILIGKNKEYSFHLFIRKVKKEDGITVPYTYFGEVEVESYKNDAPISIRYRLKNKVPYYIYKEFTIKNWKE